MRTIVFFAVIVACVQAWSDLPLNDDWQYAPIAKSIADVSVLNDIERFRNIGFRHDRRQSDEPDARSNSKGDTYQILASELMKAIARLAGSRCRSLPCRRRDRCGVAWQSDGRRHSDVIHERAHVALRDDSPPLYRFTETFDRLLQHEPRE